MTKIRALLFDFGGTLDGKGIHWRDRTYRFLRREYPRINRQTFDQADRASVEALIAGEQGPDLTLRETMDRIAAGIYERLGLDLGVKDRYVRLFCEDVNQSLAANRQWFETLRNLYQLGVISNNFGNTQGWCDEYNLLPLLDIVIDSTVAKVWKPDPEIFRMALSTLNVSPTEAVYVGDTYLDDVAGAKGVGMWTAWFVGEEEKECPDASIVDFQLAEIRELERFLEQKNRYTEL